MLYHIAVLTLLVSIIGSVLSLTRSELKREQKKGNGTLALGALMGEIKYIRRGISERGNVNGILTSYLGENVLKLGHPYVDFPVCPFIHITCYMGKKQHLDAFHLLYSLNANPNVYMLPSNNSRGYPPALLYCFGFSGRKPLNSDSAFIYRMKSTFTSVFNITIVEEFLHKTGNPPLLHIAMLNNFFEGALILIDNFKVNVNQIDEMYFNLTAVHYAVWNSDSNSLQYLVSRGADLLQSDSFGRIPLHYAVMKQDLSMVIILFRNFTQDSNNNIQLQYNMLSKKDNFGLSALDLSQYDNHIRIFFDNWIQTHRSVIDVKIFPTCHVTPIAKYARIPAVDNDWGTVRYYTSGLNINSYNYEIDIISSQNLTSHIFINYYYSLQRPLLIINGICDAQPIWAFVQHRSHFLQRYGDMILETGENLYSDIVNYNKDTTTTSIKNWINVMESSAFPGISRIQKHDTIYEDIFTPNILNICPGSGSSDISSLYQLTVGYSSSGYPGLVELKKLPRDPIWSLLLFGEIEWFLIPPAYFEIYNNITSMFRFNKEDPLRRIIDAVEWNDKLLPLLLDANIVFHTKQYPGQVLFIPRDWYFVNIHALTSISIMKSMCSHINSDMRLQPLGQKIYGGIDPYHNYGHPIQFTHSLDNTLEAIRSEEDGYSIPLFHQVSV